MKPQLVDAAPKLVIVSQVVEDGFETADGAQRVGAEGHGRAEREFRHSQQPGNEHAGSEIGGDAERLQTRRCRAAVHR